MRDSVARRFDFNDLLTEAMQLAKSNRVPLLIYIVFTGCATTLYEHVIQIEPTQNYLADGDGSATSLFLRGLVLLAAYQFVIFWSADFVLYRTILTRSAAVSRISASAIVPYYAISLLAVVCYTAGYLFFIIPGILLVGRWSIASAIMLTEGVSIRRALAESWVTVTNSTRWIIIGYFLVTAITVGAATLLGPDELPGAQSMPIDILRLLLSNMLAGANGAGLCLVALGAYFSLRRPQSIVVQVFE